MFVPIGYPSWEGPPGSNITWGGPTNTSAWLDPTFGKIVYFDPPYDSYNILLTIMRTEATVSIP